MGYDVELLSVWNLKLQTVGLTVAYQESTSPLSSFPLSKLLSQCYPDFMRFGLQRLYAKPNVLARWHQSNFLYSHTNDPSCHRYQSCISARGEVVGTWKRRSGKLQWIREDDVKDNILNGNAQVEKHGATVEQCRNKSRSEQRMTLGRIEQPGSNDSQKLSHTPSIALSSRAKGQGWRLRLVTFEQYKYESNPYQARDDQDLLINQKTYARDLNLWLELIRFRKRHFGAAGTQVLFQEMFHRGISLPTSGTLSNDFWELAIMAGHQSSVFMNGIISHASKIKRMTGQSWPGLYHGIVKHALVSDPALAYNMHVKLKDEFPPNMKDYIQLFQSCVFRDSVDDFEGLYRDLPLQGMYATVIEDLCRAHKYRHAVKWHNLLFTYGDLPAVFADIRPLSSHLAHIGDSQQLEQIVNDLRAAYGDDLQMTGAMERYVRKLRGISRETLNRHLGEVHQISPKTLSDSFCARVFATKLFYVDTVISGLQTMGLDMIGPLALREMASRDASFPVAVQRHLSRLEDAGISVRRCTFSSLLQKFTSEGELKLLRSLVECDLHPDTFEDPFLQEELLVQYYERNDLVQIERTLSAITIYCRDVDVEKWRMNLLLRCQISIHDRKGVVCTIQKMAQQNIPITTRSSRHLYVRWLTQKRQGKAACSTRELPIIINATKSTLQSGRYVPILAWKQIMLRLGMAGQLRKCEELALWIVDFYTNPTTRRDLPSQISAWQKQGIGFPPNHHPLRFLNKLFTVSAQQAIITWGFQQHVKQPPPISRLRGDSIAQARHRPVWLWGLILLHKLQSRGVPIQKSTIAQICKTRLVTLFGKGVSRRRINRRSVWLEKQHDPALDRWALGVYIRGMRDIWGKDLFDRDMKASLIKRLSEPPKSRASRYLR